MSAPIQVLVVESDISPDTFRSNCQQLIALMVATGIYDLGEIPVHPVLLGIYSQLLFDQILVQTGTTKDAFQRPFVSTEVPVINKYASQYNMQASWVAAIDYTRFFEAFGRITYVWILVSILDWFQTPARRNNIFRGWLLVLESNGLYMQVDFQSGDVLVKESINHQTHLRCQISYGTSIYMGGGHNNGYYQGVGTLYSLAAGAASMFTRGVWLILDTVGSHTITFRNGDVAKYKDNLREMVDYYFHGYSSRYVGGWLNQSLHGHGTYQTDTFQLTGTCTMGVRQGQSTLRYTDGTCWTGHWIDNEPISFVNHPVVQSAIDREICTGLLEQLYAQILYNSPGYPGHFCATCIAKLGLVNVTGHFNAATLTCSGPVIHCA